MNPLGSQTLEDWIIDFVFHNETKRRICVSPRCQEAKATQLALGHLTEEQAEGISEMSVRRRHETRIVPSFDP